MSLGSRLWDRLRSIEPFTLGFLGLVGVPGHVVESLEFLLVFQLFFLFFLWPFVAPIVGLVLGVVPGRETDDEADPIDWIYLGDWREYAAWFLAFPLTFLNPLLLAQDAMQMLGSLVAIARYRGSPPAADDYEQAVSYRLPFDGTWTVVNGGPEKDQSHSWFPVTQRYAYDFVVTDDDGRSRPEGTSTSVDNYYCYAEPVLAPADGIVVDVFDTDLEPSRGGGFSHPLKRDIRGNYVVIRHVPDEYSSLVHLVPGSVCVAPGDRVERGERVGRCGHSGNSSEPHLHFQVQDQPAFETAAGLPVQFDELVVESPVDGEIEGADERRESRAFVSAGQRVRHVGAEKADSESEREETESTRVAGVSSRTTDDGRVSNGAPVSNRRDWVSSLGRVGIGLVVGTVLALVARLLASWLPLASGIDAWLVPVAVLGIAATLAVVYRYGFGLVAGSGYVSRPGWTGVPLGLGIEAAGIGTFGWLDPSVGFGVGTLIAIWFLAGFVILVVASEYDRRRLGATQFRSLPSVE